MAKKEIEFDMTVMPTNSKLKKLTGYISIFKIGKLQDISSYKVGEKIHESQDSALTEVWRHCVMNGKKPYTMDTLPCMIIKINEPLV